ncbi:CBM96 family carbohydrate-binding protein, partial [Subtercola frigoramans]|uniref:CBM96 family carbohydrate-binding protein n=1 Tax=Subtercola frigoramans TaxID=120298 RepID=UPI003608390C
SQGTTPTMTLALSEDTGYTQWGAVGTYIMTRESSSTPYIDLVLNPLPLAISSSSASTGTPALTTDGSDATMWTATGDQTINWVLASAQPVKTFMVNWKANSTQHTKYEFQTSTDSITWTTQYNGSYDGPDGWQTIVTTNAPAGKYLRFLVHGNETTDKTTTIKEVRFYSYDTTTPGQTLPPPLGTRLGSVSSTGVPTGMTIGQTATVSYTPKDTTGTTMSATGMTAVYTSGNNAIATVDANGNVTAIAIGTTTISVSVTSAGVTINATPLNVTITDPTRVRLYATADTYVQGGSAAANNFGTASSLVVKATSDPATTRYGYLSFDLSGLTGMQVESAVLSLRGQVTETPGSSVKLDAHAATGAWTETGINYNNKPTMGATVGSTMLDGTLTYRSADITTYVQSQGTTPTMTLALSEDTGYTQWGAVGTYIMTRESSSTPYIDLVLSPL